MNRYVLAGVGVLALCCLSFAGGRWLAPQKVKIVEVQAKVDVDKSKKVETKVDTHKVEDQQQQQKTVVVYKDRIIHPDGTQEEHEVSKTTTENQQVHIDLTSAATTAAEAVEHTSVDIRASAKTEERSQPSLHLGLLAGLRLHDLQPVVGALAEKRVLGPVSAGVWALAAPKATSPDVTVGISLSISL